MVSKEWSEIIRLTISRHQSRGFSHIKYKVIAVGENFICDVMEQRWLKSMPTILTVQLLLSHQHNCIFIFLWQPLSMSTNVNNFITVHTSLFEALPLEVAVVFCFFFSTLSKLLHMWGFTIKKTILIVTDIFVYLKKNI